jgi:hypothetical protein
MEQRQATQQSPGNQTRHVLEDIAVHCLVADWIAARLYGRHHNKTFVYGFATPLRFDGCAEIAVCTSGTETIEGQGISVVC